MNPHHKHNTHESVKKVRPLRNSQFLTNKTHTTKKIIEKFGGIKVHENKEGKKRYITFTSTGGKEKNKHANSRTKGTQGRSTKTKTAIVGMRSRNGVVKATKVDKVNSNAIQNMMNKAIDKNPTRYTDEAPIYKGIAGYKQRMVNHSAGEFVSGAVNTNGIESVWAILKRGYYGTFHH